MSWEDAAEARYLARKIIGDDYDQWTGDKITEAFARARAAQREADIATIKALLPASHYDGGDMAKRGETQMMQVAIEAVLNALDYSIA